MDFNFLPDCLSPDYPHFENFLRSLLPRTSEIESWRTFAILIYRIRAIELILQLWQMYRRSGTGQLSPPLPIDPTQANVWPSEVESLLPIPSQLDYRSIDQRCRAFVDRCLHDLRMKNVCYEYERMQKRRSFIDYAEDVEEKLIHFINEAMQYQRSVIAHQIVLVQLDFNATILKRIFWASHLHPSQVSGTFVHIESSLLSFVIDFYCFFPFFSSV